MVRVLGSPMVLAAVGLCLAASVMCVQDSPITRIDNPGAWKKFLEKMANTELDYMNSEESENQEAVVKSPKENASVESDESVEELGSVETGVGKNSTSGGPQSDATLFHHLFGDMNKDLANVFNMIVKTAAERQWWRGDNVCVDREEKVEHTNDTDSGTGQLNQLFSFGAAQFSSCRHSPSKYVCTTTTHKRGESKTVTVTYQCCYGFRRLDNQGQCVKVDLKPMTDLMGDLGGAEFMKMVKSVNMGDTLESKNLTVFVPNDEAVKQYESEIYATNNVRLRRRIEDNDVLSGESDKDYLSPSDMVLSHVIPGIVDMNEVSTVEVFYSENHNSSVRMNVYPGEKEAVVTANCAEVKSANNPSTAGLVHVVSKVLKPVHKSVVELIRSEPSLSMFSQMLESANLTQILKDHPHVTVYAPNNAAFDKMEAGLRNKYIRGQACIKSVLKHHIVPHTICTAAIPNRKRSTIDMNGEWLSLERDPSGSLVVGEKAHTEQPDLMATNGVVHIVNKVIQPKSAQPTSQILSQSNHTSWLDFLQFFKFYTYTFNRFPDIFSFMYEASPRIRQRVSMMLEYLKRPLKYSFYSTFLIIDMSTFIGGMRLAYSVFTLLRLPLFSGFQPRATVQCARIINTDEKGCETVAHEIDRLLEPPTQTTLEFIKNNPNLTVLNQILEVTSSGPYEYLRRGRGSPP
ncbi:transforming growth factor-beta-induced protein ig-h3-like [Diaphorina citri]|uniref:Transforming growth factor-beta-induced protein ig-h3-like n=1 Tax=Diaphorina citri TaxID=121845 RepID=A0A3Q0IWB0_DIACI|nr:transforming growth factor-beta-induced protein ig-h3-like [Diaphorina citri]